MRLDDLERRADDDRAVAEEDSDGADGDIRAENGVSEGGENCSDRLRGDTEGDAIGDTPSAAPVAMATRSSSSSMAKPSRLSSSSRSSSSS